jgi:hypothetical protein
MTKPRDLAEEQIEDDLKDLEGAGIDLPARIQARWRRSDLPRKMPREREEARALPHRLRRGSD